jgi:5-methylcytosine-specific restriction endonuclease McrA
MYKDGSKQTGGKTYRQHTTLKDAIRKEAGYKCAICGEYGDQVDHIIPWQVSHDSSINNLRVLCRKCNLATRRQRRDARLELGSYYDSLLSQLK